MAEEKNQEPLFGSLEAGNVPETGEVSVIMERLRKISSEMLMIFLIGFLFGYAVKTEFSKRINVVDKTFYGKQAFNFIEMQNRQDAAAAAEVQEQGQIPDQPQP